MRKIILMVLLLSAMHFVQAADLATFFRAADLFLKEHVDNGKVNYQNIYRSPKKLQILTNFIARANLQGASEAEKKAFYINTYNLLVIKAVLKYYPLQSPMDQNGFFDKVKHQVAGQTLTLNAIEIQKLLKTYQDPRIHFALACASVSCPKLRSGAYQPKNIDQQLDTHTRMAINDPTFIRVDQVANQVEVSKLFEWYKDDFKKADYSIRSFINKYRRNNIPANYSIGYYEYNWSLNEA